MENTCFTEIILRTVLYLLPYHVLVSTQMAQKMEETLKTMPKLTDSQSWANSKYYKGGFEPKMTKREAALILGNGLPLPPLLFAYYLAMPLSTGIVVGKGIHSTPELRNLLNLRRNASKH